MLGAFDFLQREHRLQMRNSFEAFRGCASHSLTGRSGCDEFRKLLLQIEQFLKEPVVFEIADGWACLDVVSVIMLANLLGQSGMARFCLNVRHHRKLAVKSRVQSTQSAGELERSPLLAKLCL